MINPRLPMDFTDYDLDGPGGGRLIVIAGLPGTGKSTLAEQVARRLDIPLFSMDWLLGALTPFGGRAMKDLLGVGEELLTTLAVQQLSRGQSVILDAPVESPATRERWASLARRAGAQFRVVVCVCSDQNEHRRRFEGRQRVIPGWHSTGEWSNVERRIVEFVPWDGPVLVLDTATPGDHVTSVLHYLSL